MMQNIKRKIPTLFIFTFIVSIMSNSLRAEEDTYQKGSPVKIHKSYKETIEGISCQSHISNCNSCWDFSNESCLDENQDNSALWFLNTTYLKDAFYVVTFPSFGNNTLVITRQLIHNASKLSEVYAGKDNNDIRLAIIKQNFFLYTYVFLKRIQGDVSSINQRLESTNHELLRAFKKALQLDEKETEKLKRALNRRLNSLKELGDAFVEAFFDENFENVYVKYKKSLRAAERVEKLLS